MRKIVAYSFIPLLGLGLFLGTSVASARGFLGNPNITPAEMATRQSDAFAHQAQILGLSLDEVKEAWANGTSIKDLITAKGLNQTDIQARMKTVAFSELKTQLSSLVSQGVITQAQADTRLAFMQTRLDSAKGKGGRGFGGMGGMHRGMGF